MTLVRYNPNHWLNRMSRDLDGMFGAMAKEPASCRNCMPRVDIIEDSHNLMLEVELPGMDKDEIKVMVEDGVLSISGERKMKNEEKDRNYLRSEIAYGAFSRSFTLSDNVDTENISADYKNGILNITLAKSEKALPKEIKVEVK